MLLHHRLQRLEVRTHVAVENLSPQTDRDWLAAFREVGRNGLSHREPDFERALAEYETAIERQERES